MNSILILPTLVFAACFSQPSSNESERRSTQPRLFSGGLRKVADSLNRGTARIEHELTALNPPKHKIMGTYRRWDASQEKEIITNIPLVTVTCSSPTTGHGELRVGSLADVAFSCACNATVCPSGCAAPDENARYIIETLCNTAMTAEPESAVATK